MVRESGPIGNKNQQPLESTPENLKSRILEREAFIKSICRRKLGRSGRIDAAEAVANEVLYKALKQADKDPVVGNLDAWLTVVSINTVNSYLRKIMNEPTDPQTANEVWNLDLLDEGPSIEEALISEEGEALRLTALHEAIEKLPEMRKKFIKMNLEGKTATEISRELGINKNTISRTISEARKHIARNLGQSDDFKIKRSGKN